MWLAWEYEGAETLGSLLQGMNPSMLLSGATLDVVLGPTAASKLRRARGQRPTRQPRFQRPRTVPELPPPRAAFPPPSSFPPLLDTPP